MRKILLIACAVAMFGCTSTQKAGQTLTGPAFGELPNYSAEVIVNSRVAEWNSDPRAEGVKHFYDNIAKDGSKSLFIEAEGFADGSWTNKVNLKPWSKYKMTGWVKTENVKPENEGGAGIALYGMPVEVKSFDGTNDWTQVEYEFETGNNDCATVACLLGTRGKARGKVWFDDIKFQLLSSENIKTNITVNPAVQKEEMPLYIYGQFIEHMGECIYGGIWAEMLMDRKFWYAPGERNSVWKINGGEGSQVIMDKAAPFTGAHTPMLVNNGSLSIEQPLLGFRKDMGYTGYVIAKADKPTTVNVIFKDGNNELARTQISVGTSYQKLPVEFTSTVLTKDGRFEIAPTEKGKLWIGTASLMPNDNVEGFRADVLALLKELKSPVYRWPGGNFVSGYDWRDGLGDRDKRPPRKNPAWTGVELNDMGIHEFMRLCELLETEPYIAVNAGLGGVEMARQEVEYCNGDTSTPMGKIRVQNGGTATPWNVKWWSIGNEMYGGWQLGHMSTEQFVVKHNQFADAMRGVDPSIKLIAVGNVGPWDEMVMANCSDKMDLISEHFYCQDWHGGGLMTHVKQIPDNIRNISEAHRKYRETIPALKGKDIRICMDEWNYWYGPHIYGELGTRYFLRDALGIAAGINEYLRQSDIVFMANYAQTVNVIGAIKATTTDATLASTGEVLKMYREYFGTIPVEISGELRPFDAAAAINKENKTLTLSVVNPTWDNVSFDFHTAGSEFEVDGQKVKLNGKAKLYKVTADSDMAYNIPGQPSAVTIQESEINSTKKLTVEPFSANIFVISYE